MPTNMPPKPAMPAAAKPAPGMGGKAAIGLVGLIVGLIAGYGAGRVSTGTPVNPLMPSPNQPPVAGGGPAEEEPAAPEAPDESNSLNGKVVSSDGSHLVFDADLSFYDPSGVKKLGTRRTANITAETKIVRLVERTPAEMDAAMEAFQKAESDASPDSPPPAPPTLFKEVPVSASAIAAGENVSVVAASDILRASSFDALAITIAPEAPEQPSPPTPDAPPAP